MSVAVWYMSHHQPGYTLCRDEEDAARTAWGINDSENASVTGAQFSDGRLVKIDNWPAYEKIAKEYDRLAGEQSKSYRPSNQRKIKDPFRGFELSIDSNAPEWLGVTS